MTRIRKTITALPPFYAAAFAAFLTLTSPASAAANNPLVIGGKARFTVITPILIRMEYATSGKFIDEPSLFAMNRAARWNDINVDSKDNVTMIDTGAMQLFYLDNGEPFSERNLGARFLKGTEPVEWYLGLPNNGNLGGTIRTVDGVWGPVDLGEGVLSRDGWYLLDDSARHVYTKDWVAQRPDDSGLDLYLFAYGLDYKAGLKALTAIGGPVPLPRKYALGVWYSRYWPYSSKEYRQIVQEYKDNDFPLDVMVMDMDWHKDNWTGWSWNRKLLPDAEKLLPWFHKQGLAVTMNLHPADGVGPHEDKYADFMKALGKDPATKETVPFDAGGKKYIDALFSKVIAPLEKDGVDFWWLDWQQYPNTRSIPDLTNLRWLNDYFYKHTSAGGKRGQSFSRWPGWGDHRHPIHFSGDSFTNWGMLAFIVPFTSTAGNVGAFYWSHDIGGHMGNRNEEGYTRWAQFGAVSTAMRSHSTRSAEQDRRPWKYPDWARDSMRRSFHLRSILFPYIYSSARRCFADSLPLNRPMYLEYPDKDDAYHNPQQFFYGDALLAAPIVTPGVGVNRLAKQVVWFPEGVWYNWFTGERFEGPSEQIVTADINEFPLYARGGVPIPTQPYSPRMSTAPLDKLVIRCYPGAYGETGKFTLYEDDGISTAYLKKKFAETQLTCTRKGNAVTVKIAAAKGDYPGRVKARSYVIELPFTNKATSVNINGKAAKAEYDKAGFTNRVRVPKTATNKGVTITLTAAMANPGGPRAAAFKRRLGGMFSKASAVDQDVAALKNELTAALRGIAFFNKNEALYLYKGTPKTYFYAMPGVVDGDSMALRVEDREENQVTTHLDGKTKITGADQYYVPANLPALAKSSKFGVPVKRFYTATFSIAGKPYTIETLLDENPSFITGWKAVGSFDYQHNTPIAEKKFGPETGPLNLKAVYTGQSGQKVKWHGATTDAKGIVDVNKLTIPGLGRLFYAATQLKSDKAQSVMLRIHATDRVLVWLNGDIIFTGESQRFSNSDFENVPVTLKAGENLIMLKTGHNSMTPWEFSVAVEYVK